MLKLITDNNPADYTPIIDALARFISDGDAFAEFFVDRMLDPYMVNDVYDGDTPEENRLLAIDEVRAMLRCPHGIETIADMFEEAHDWYRED